MIRIGDTTRDLRLNKIKTDLDAGASSATLKLYGSTMAASLAIAATGSVLASFDLPDPCGVISAHGLVITLAAGAVVLVDGTAVWGRFYDSDNNPVLDVDCGLLASGAFLEMQTTLLVAGKLIVLPTITIND